VCANYPEGMSGTGGHTKSLGNQTEGLGSDFWLVALGFALLLFGLTGLDDGVRLSLWGLRGLGESVGPLGLPRWSVTLIPLLVAVAAAAVAIYRDGGRALESRFVDVVLVVVNLTSKIRSRRNH
jgi:hypothetical protein